MGHLVDFPKYLPSCLGAQESFSFFYAACLTDLNLTIKSVPFCSRQLKIIGNKNLLKVKEGKRVKERKKIKSIVYSSNYKIARNTH